MSKNNGMSETVKKTNKLLLILGENKLRETKRALIIALIFIAMGIIALFIINNYSDKNAKQKKEEISYLRENSPLSIEKIDKYISLSFNKSRALFFLINQKKFNKTAFEYFLKKGANINARNNLGKTVAVNFILEQQHLQIKKILTELKISTNSKWINSTELSSASFWKRLRFLMENGATSEVTIGEQKSIFTFIENNKYMKKYTKKK